MTRHIDVRAWGERVKARLDAAPKRPAPERPDPVPTYADHRAWDAALSRSCPAHDAASGEPCWVEPTAALCGARTPAAPAATPWARRATKRRGL